MRILTLLFHYSSFQAVVYVDARVKSETDFGPERLRSELQLENSGAGSETEMTQKDQEPISAYTTMDDKDIPAIAGGAMA